MKVWMILDEAATVEHMECLDDMVDKFRGYGIRSIMAYQSMGQLNQCWPEGRSQTLLSNTTQIFFGVNDPQTAEYVSSRLGEATITVTSGGSSLSKARTYHSMLSAQPHNDGINVTRGTNDGWSQMARRLLKPEEVLAMSPRMAITFMPGLPPLLTRLVRYFEEPRLFRRPNRWGIRLSLPAAVKAAAFMICGLACAGAMTVIAYEREQYHPGVYDVQRPFMGRESGGGRVGGGQGGRAGGGHARAGESHPSRRGRAGARTQHGLGVPPLRIGPAAPGPPALQ